MDEFWWVYSEGAAGAPTKRHGNQASAHREALRLATMNPGHVFIVLRAIGSALLERPEARWRDAEQDIPF